MSAWRRGLAATGIVSLAFGCGGSPSVPAPVSPPLAVAQPPAGTASVSRPSGPIAMPKVPDPGPVLPPLTYEAKGRRDPFVPVRVTTDKAGLDVGTLKLAGIIRGRASEVQHRRADEHPERQERDAAGLGHHLHASFLQRCVEGSAGSAEPSTS